MADSARILFVSAAEGNASVMAEFLEEHGYPAIAATSLEEFDTALDNHTIDLVLIDADGFPPAVWDRCERLQQAGIPFFVISKHQQAASRRGNEHDATRVFEKPLGQEALVTTIEQLLDES